MDRTPDDTSADQTAWAYLFTAFMLAALAALALLRSLWKATVWRVELPDTPDHRRKLADAIDHLVDGVASSEERAEFLDVRYLHPQIEQVRRRDAQARRAAPHRASRSFPGPGKTLDRGDSRLGRLAQSVEHASNH